jgi:2-methylcitrate dehydratase PrpD
MNETKQLAHFITSIQYDDLDHAVIEKAKGLILEQLGCQLAFATLPWSRAVYDYVRDRKSNREESTVVHYGLRTTMDDAAFANAVFNHGFEMDDDEPNSVSHPGCVVIPPALALGEKDKTKGKEFLTAVVVGYDVMIRIGTATRPLIKRGFHGTPVIGTFGAAAAVSKILQLNTDTVLHALGIAASNTGGIAEYTVSGGSVKRLHAGFASQGGLRAAFLAQYGLTAPATALEGEKGFC